ncbi:MAG: glycosyltransferase family 2 protein [Candidatus Hydrogenedentes bacterium]|nr:glycosyltransferase family 2 protein [Candidatus Hydrogenedentota bacterium]
MLQHDEIDTRGKAETAVQLSVVIPVFNEEGNLRILHERLTKALGAFGWSYELVFVDDGSTDGSFDALRGLYERDPAVHILRFTRNYGQQMACTAGFRYAHGGVVVLMDSDLQVAPEEIPLLVNKLREGYDIVYGVRTTRVESWVRRTGSQAVSRILSRITGVNTPDNASGFLALDRQFVDNINLFNEKSRYLSGIMAWLSYGRWAAVPVSHFPRHAGVTKYNFRKLAALTFNLICSSTLLPLRAIFCAGWLTMALGALGLLGAAGFFLAEGNGNAAGRAAPASLRHSRSMETVNAAAPRQIAGLLAELLV